MRRSRRAVPALPVVLLVALFTACLLFSAPAAAQGRSEYVNEPYQFTIAPMPRPWRVLDERAVPELVPDASAGVIDGRGLYGVVIVETVPDGNLETYARFLVDSMVLEHLREHRFERIEFQGVPAIRFAVSGRISDIEVAYQNTVFIRGGHLYQVLGWGLSNLVEADSFAPFFDAFGLLDGEITGAASDRVVPDTSGVGWRVTDGTFESAVYRLRVRRGNGWRLAVGEELSQMNTDAEIGLIHGKPEAYMTIIAERAAGVNQSAFARTILDDDADAALVATRHTREVVVDGHAVTLRRYDMQAPPIEMWKGVFFEGDVCYQIVAWYMGGLRDQALEALTGAFDAVEIMDAADAAAVANELAVAPDTQNRVGSAFSLRRGVYRDFGHKFVWRKPEGFWRVLAGDEARAQHPDATLVLESPTHGVFGLLIMEDTFGLDDVEYHAAVVSGLTEANGRVLAGPRTMRAGGRPAAMSVVEVEAGGVELVYHTTTLVDGDSAMQMVFYGLSGNMRSSAAAIDQAVQGLTFPSSLSPVRAAKSGSVTDLRLGYALDLPSGRWTRRNITPGEMEPIASMNQWVQGTSSVVVVAMCALSEGQDPDWFIEFLEGYARERMGALAAGKPVRSTGALGSMDAQRLTWKGRDGSLDLYVGVRDLTAYAVIVTNDGEETLPAEAVVSGFALVD